MRNALFRLDEGRAAGASATELSCCNLLDRGTDEWGQTIYGEEGWLC